MASKRKRGLILAAGVTGLLALSVGAANASVNPHLAPQGRPIVTISWTGPDVSEAACQAAAAAEKKYSNVLEANCLYEQTDPATDVGGPGWYLYLAVESVNN
jgi:hypothetical protein